MFYTYIVLPLEIIYNSVKKGGIKMFNIDIEKLKQKVVAEIGDITEKELVEAGKLQPIEAIGASIAISTSHAVNICLKVIEENNKALWNELVSKGIIKE